MITPPLLRALGWLSAAAIAAALVVAARAPEEVVMGGLIRILYVHAPAAWTAYLAYAVAAAGSGMYLATRSDAYDEVAVAAAEWGVVLTTVTLVTGSLWGRAASNWWWNWGDTRLLLTLLMWFLYVAYLVLRHFVPDPAARTASAVLALVGVPVMALNHFAVTLWQRAHPPPVVVRPGGPAVDGPILVALVTAFIAFTVLFFTVLAWRVRLERLRRPGYQP